MHFLVSTVSLCFPAQLDKPPTSTVLFLIMPREKARLGTNASLFNIASKTVRWRFI